MKKKDPRVFFEAVRPQIRPKLSSDLREFQRFKFMITFGIELYKEKLDGRVDYDEPLFHPRNQFVLFEPNEIEARLTETFAQIQAAIENRTHNGSGWIVDIVSYLWKLPFRDINP